MVAKWEQQEGNTGLLTFGITADEFETALDQAFKKVRKDIELPGFRKGKIPRKLFESRFGVESLYQDAVDLILQDAYRKAIDETGIQPIEQPEVDIETIERGKDVVFTANVNVKPEATLGEYKGLEVEEQSLEVTDEEVDEAIERLQQEHVELVVKEEGSIEEGDTVVMDFEGFTDGVAFDGGKAENHSLEIGSGQFIPGFEEQLIGKDLDAETSINLTFPEDYHAEELAGKEATFQVKVHEVKYKEFPELDDEFAKDVDEEAESLDELKQKKREELESQKEQEAERQKRDTLLEKASDNTQVEIPDAMVDTELDQMIREFEQQLQQQGMTMEMYTQFSGQDESAMKEQMREDAKKRVKTNLTLEAIVNAEGLEATDEDVDAELDNMAGMYGIEKEQLKQILGGNADAIKEDLKFKKALDFLVEQSKTVE
ncbi:trigger factor [Virgibacillus sp. NKC19-16]|uniref:trigger factor n=1 Tax=Virgibacillus salidurans TaxID=2831673 RepID=UPI001F1CA09B|nr:trigger factor [Virgibacillus sp. NKC19-16]UJL44988.1 trigger factor [Virgibacillus sp. NKC19-16]